MAAWQVILYAMFTWYFSTGLILYLDGLPVRTFRLSLLAATIVLAASTWGLAASSGITTPASARCGFTCGVLSWAWQEMAFLMGIVTGPRRQGRSPGAAGWRYFGQAVQTLLYHELAILAGALVVVTASWGGANQVGTWTYLILWAMRTSAKLNVFLGVRNLSLEFLPPHLDFLRSYLNCRPMNLLFPFSITATTILAIVLVQAADAPGASAFAITGSRFLATLTVLALVEHWFMVIPLPFAQLWSWGMRSHRAARRTLGARHSGPEAVPSARPPLAN